MVFQQTFDNAADSGHTACDELRQIILAAAGEMAFDDLIDIADCIRELDEVFPPMIGERDFCEYDPNVAEFFEPDLSTAPISALPVVKPFATVIRYSATASLWHANGGPVWLDTNLSAKDSALADHL